MTSRWRFISEHHEEYGIQRLCRILRVSRSGFYRWRIATSARRARAAAEVELTEQIRGIHGSAKGAYGMPRITRELRESGPVVNHKRVARLMRAAGISGCHLRIGKRTTIQDVRALKAPDLLSGIPPCQRPLKIHRLRRDLCDWVESRDRAARGAGEAVGLRIAHAASRPCSSRGTGAA